MASWTQLIWNDTAHMLEYGTEKCNLHHNPLYIDCGLRKTPNRWSIDYKLPTPRYLDILSLNVSEVRAITNSRGLHLMPINGNKAESPTTRKSFVESDKSLYKAVLMSDSSYSQLGK